MKKSVILASFLSVVFTSAQVADTVRVRDIDEITVSASKKLQKVVDVPATVNIITAKDIAQFTSFNVGELAARQKGVDFVRGWSFRNRNQHSWF